VSVGYDLARVRALGYRTRDAIDDLRRVRSDDPAAADALRAVGALRRTLEDHWMTALFDIERSRALSAWSTLGVRSSTPVTGPQVVPSSSGPGSGRPARWEHLELAEFIAIVERADRRLDSTDPPSDTDLDALAQELRDRLRHDPDAVTVVRARAGSLPIIAALLARTTVGTDVTIGVLAAMTRPEGLVSDVELDRHRRSFEALLASLLDQPAACLDLLGDRSVLAAIAAWPGLEADLVETVVRTGLHDAVVAAPERLADGYAVLGELTRLTNGALDGGIAPAVALGVATSMVGYVDTLAPAIRHEGSAPVVVVDERHDDGRGLDVELGSYDDLVDLFGVVLRDPAAGAALGTVLGGYAASTIERLGARIVDPPGVEPVARFADLLADAARTEQAELVMEAATEESRRRTLTGAVGFGTGLVMAVSGVGAITRSISARAIAMAGDRLAAVEPDGMPDSQLASGTYDLLVLGAVSLVTRDPTVRRHAGLGVIPTSTWREVRRRVGTIEAEPDPDERARGVTRLERWIAAEVPLLDRYVGEMRSAPGMDELTEARNAVGAD